MMSLVHFSGCAPHPPPCTSSHVSMTPWCLQVQNVEHLGPCTSSPPSPFTTCFTKLSSQQSRVSPSKLVSARNSRLEGDAQTRRLQRLNFTCWPAHSRGSASSRRRTQTCGLPTMTRFLR
ncbi:hypothetical protein BRADI_4g09827v3 [Brachypodium distachyon]|uniref:Uncharacterized protein n=1 Tax=Brachypodium distachyon TaxID=15368 RepID=A0A0Q3L3N9_BRADI|nr:hypothetical protein BRADI_4g09827v3 [Brachypodium distachyon]